MPQDFLPINSILIVLIAVAALVVGANIVAALMNLFLGAYIKIKGL